MVVLAWAAVLTGAYVMYPWYRAAAPPSTVDLSAFPQRLLMANPMTVGWHSLGMEWKEHVARFTPIPITMVTFLFIKYGGDLKITVSFVQRCSALSWPRSLPRVSLAFSAR